MSNGYRYLPIPPRVWSRVQNNCSLTNGEISDTVYVPLLNQTVTISEAEYYAQLIAKGNVLQYKKNSSNLTQKQRYSQIVKGKWVNRTTTWATQSDTYTNPNTKNLQPSGATPLAREVSTSLLCNTTVNPITGAITVTKSNSNFNPTTASDVPGQTQYLYWDPRIQTWYPRQRYIMSNSLDKWPVNYKGFVSAIRPNAPTIINDSYGSNYISFSWSYTDSECIPITNFAIYVDNVLFDTVPLSNSSFTIDNLNNSTEYSIYIVALSSNIPSDPSNTITITTETIPLG